VRKLLEPAACRALHPEPPSCIILSWYGLLWTEKHDCGFSERDGNFAMGFANTWLNCWAI